MPRTADLDNIRALILLLAAVIGLVSVILNIIHTHAKEAATPEAKQRLYRNVVSWIESALWVAGLIASFAFGQALVFYFWLPAYTIGCYLFLTSDEKRLRQDIFRLVLYSQAIVLMAMLYYVQKFLTILDSFIRAFGSK